MFTKRIIPCLDVNNGRVVKGVNFVNLKDAGDPVEIAAAYDQAFVPSQSILVRRISPAPRSQTLFAHSTASIPVSILPPCL